MAKLSNSALEAFCFCPEKYNHRYLTGLTQSKTPDYLLFGTRLHNLLQFHYCPPDSGICPPPPDDLSLALENEAQAMFEGYKAAYLQEPFEPVECERSFELVVPGTLHTYVGRIDMVVRDKVSGRLELLETKTENRSSRRNLPQAWTARHQGSLYAWAASMVYNEPVDSINLNVLTRGSEKGQIGPTYRRDKLHRTPEQIQKALIDLTWTANQLDTLGTGDYPRFTANCVNERGYNCDYYNKCHLGSDEGLVAIEPYSYLQLNSTSI